MAITISLQPNNVDSSASNFVYAVATLTFSGNYPTGGDTLDFTQIANQAAFGHDCAGVRGKPEWEQRILHPGAGNSAEQLEIEGVCGRRDGDRRGGVSRNRDRGYRAAFDYGEETVVAERKIMITATSNG